MAGEVGYLEPICWAGLSTGRSLGACLRSRAGGPGLTAGPSRSPWPRKASWAGPVGPPRRFQLPGPGRPLWPPTRLSFEPPVGTPGGLGPAWLSLELGASCDCAGVHLSAGRDTHVPQAHVELCACSRLCPLCWPRTGQGRPLRASGSLRRGWREAGGRAAALGALALSWECRHSPRQSDQASGGAGAVRAGRLGVSVAVGVPIIRTD